MSFRYRESGDGYLAQLEYSQQRIETISGACVSFALNGFTR